MNIKTEIKYDIGKKGVPPVVYAVQGENASRTIELHLVFNGEIFNVDDYSVSFVYKKPDGTSGWYDKLPDGSGAIDFYGNFVSVIIAPQVLSVPGEVRCAVRIEHVDSGKRRATTFPIIIDVSEDPAIDAPKSENYYSVQTWDDVNERLDAIEYILNDAIIDDARVSTNTAWSSKNTVDKLCPSFNESGAMVVCEPVESYPLEVVSHIVPKQAGSGDPSPDNIRPITGYDTVKLSRTGKNHFDVNAVENSGTAVVNNGDGTLTVTVTTAGAGVGFGQQLKKIAPGLVVGETYILSAKSTGAANYIYLLGVNKAWSFNDQPMTMTQEILDSTVGWYAGDPLVAVLSDIQIEKGTVATTYEPYKGDTFTIDFGQTVYGGRFNWQTGALTISYTSIVLDGTTSGKKVTSTDPGAKHYAFCVPSAKPKLDGNAYGDMTKCETAIGVVVQVHMLQDITGVTDSDSDSAVVTKINAVLKNWYDAGTPLTCVYEIETPTTIQLTPQEILALSGTNCLFSDTGDTEVSGKADPTAVIQDLYAKLNAVMATTAALTGV